MYEVAEHGGRRPFRKVLLNFRKRRPNVNPQSITAFSDDRLYLSQRSKIGTQMTWVLVN